MGTQTSVFPDIILKVLFPYTNRGPNPDGRNLPRLQQLIRQTARDVEEKGNIAGLEQAGTLRRVH